MLFRLQRLRTRWIVNHPCTVGKNIEGGVYAYVLTLYLRIGTEKISHFSYCCRRCHCLVTAVYIVVARHWLVPSP
jgi:hypothetical protein